VNVDIDELKCAEQALRESEYKLRQMPTDAVRFLWAWRPMEKRPYQMHLAELVFALPQCLLCALELVNIHVHPDPLQQGSIARPDGSTRLRNQR